MKNENKTFTLVECLVVVGILLFVFGIAIQDLIHSVRASEEKKVRAAETEYSAVRNMFAEQYRADSAGASGANTARAPFANNSASH